MPSVALLGMGAASRDFDIVNRHGRALDGAANLWVLADIALMDGRIVRFGTVTGKGATGIDATRRLWAPTIAAFAAATGSDRMKF